MLALVLLKSLLQKVTAAMLASLLVLLLEVSLIAIDQMLLVSLVLVKSLLQKVPTVVLASLLLLDVSAIAIVFRHCWCSCC